MIVNGWRLYLYPLIDEQLRQLEEKVVGLAQAKPDHYKEHPATKLLVTIHRYMTEIIARDPNAAEFRQGNTLGADNRHWFRAKFHQRYRLFYRFSSQQKVIIYVWVNDEQSLRKSGAKTDPYFIFRAMLEAGDPPQTMEQLLLRAKQLTK